MFAALSSSVVCTVCFVPAGQSHSYFFKQELNDTSENDSNPKRISFFIEVFKLIHNYNYNKL